MILKIIYAHYNIPQLHTVTWMSLTNDEEPEKPDTKVFTLRDSIYTMF